MAGDVFARMHLLGPGNARGRRSPAGDRRIVRRSPAHGGPDLPPAHRLCLVAGAEIPHGADDLECRSIRHPRERRPHGPLQFPDQRVSRGRDAIFVGLVRPPLRGTHGPLGNPGPAGQPHRLRPQPAQSQHRPLTAMPDIATRTVRCAGGLPAFLAVPATDAKVPAVVLMHERYGLVRHTRDLAERFARYGFVCIAPDFFHKHPDQAALHRGDVGYDMTDPEAVAYLEAAIAEIVALAQVDAARIAVKGVCQTGRHPLVLAAQRPIAAALVWYGRGVAARMASQRALSQGARRDHRRGRMSGSRYF